MRKSELGMRKSEVGMRKLEVEMRKLEPGMRNGEIGIQPPALRGHRDLRPGENVECGSGSAERGRRKVDIIIAPD